MFKTYWAVTKNAGDSQESTAYFDTKEKARQYAESLLSKHKDSYVYVESHHPEGSMLLSWIGDVHTVEMNDFAWVRDSKDGGIEFHTEEGVPIRFSNIDEVNEFIIKSQNNEETYQESNPIRERKSRMERSV